MQIAIISGKGGTGKSSITAAFATLQDEIVLADCDVDAANLYLLFNPTCDVEYAFVSGQKAILDKEKCINCGICIDYCRFEAITQENDEVNINETLCDGCILCSRICPQKAISIVNEDDSRMYAGYFKNGRMVYGRLAPGEENSGRLVNLVRSKAKEISEKAKIGTIIIDGPPGIGCPVVSTITGVDKVVVVTEPTLSGLHDLKRTLEVTANFKLQTSVIINKFDINLEMSTQIEIFCKAIGICVIGKIPFDKQIVDAMVNCQSIVDYAPESKVTHLLKETFSKLMEQ